MISVNLKNLDLIPPELGGDLYLINGNMTKLDDAGIFAATTAAGKEDENDEEVLEVEESDGDQSGDAGADTGEDAVSKTAPSQRKSWFDDDVTPKLFRDELFAEKGDITIWINSPGGDCVAAAQIYNMMMEYPGNVTVKIDGIAASAASVIAMAGTKVLVSPVSMLMIHNPMTAAMGDSTEMQKAIAMLDEVKESIINAYEIKIWYESCQALPSHGCRDLDGCTYGH